MKRVLLGLGSLAALAGLVLGLPAVLIALGPPRIPWTRLPDLLLRPDDGTLALAVVQTIAWLVWAILTVSIVVEVIAALRRLPAPSIRGLRLPQHLARGLVASAVALFLGGAATLTPAAVAAPTLPITATERPTTARLEPRATTSNPDMTASAHEAAPLNRTTRTTTYTVKRGDSLWRIAHRELGAGKRYPEIVRLNKTLLNGRPNFLLPGWTLTLPATEPGNSLPTRTPEPHPPVAQPSSSATTATPSLPVPEAFTTPAASTAPLTMPARPAPDAGALPVVPVPAASGGVNVPPAATAPVVAPTATDEDAEPFQASWLVAGLSGAGVLLCGGLALQLRRRRREQARHRRPGRAVPPLPAAVAPIHKTMIAHDAAVATVETLDRVLRALAVRQIADRATLPTVAAVELGQESVTLHLSTDAHLPEPWHADPSDLHWTLRLTDVDESLPTTPAAPWPQLVTIGTDAHGHWWLLNLEEVGVLHVTGDPAFADDLVRYLVAELAVNPWSRDVRIDCLNTCSELVGLEPGRVLHHDAGDTVVADITRDAAAMIARLSGSTAADVADARAAEVGDDLWPSRALIAGDHTAHSEALGDLASVVLSQVGRTGTSIIVARSIPLTGTDAGMQLQLDADGRLLLPATGLELTPVGLTEQEAGGCAQLLAAADTDTDDVEIPTRHDPDDEPWQQHCNEAGHLVDERLLDRATPDRPEDASSVLPADDHDYLEVAATTPADLTELAPLVPPVVRADVEADDPHLDDDLAEWTTRSGERPRLTVLGPLASRTGRGGNPLAITKRKAYYTELLAYLTLENGVTTGQVADAMGISTERVRKDIAVLRVWLGTDPRTGEKYLPEANNSRTGQLRGAGSYEANGLLCDADLFRRLRVRGEARGEHGLDDLRAALTLVTGKPFDQLRTGGGTWLVDTALQQHYVCAIVDVAHLVAIVSQHRGDLRVARAAAELALLAAPHEEIPRLDLAAIAAAEGHHHEATRIVRDHVIDPFEDEAPPELSRRTEAILRRHAWLQTTHAS